MDEICRKTFLGPLLECKRRSSIIHPRRHEVFHSRTSHPRVMPLSFIILVSFILFSWTPWPFHSSLFTSFIRVVEEQLWRAIPAELAFSHRILCVLSLASRRCSVKDVTGSTLPGTGILVEFWDIWRQFVTFCDVLRESAREEFWNMDIPRVQSGLNYQPWVSVFNLCNAVVGAGVLSFPFAFRQSGIYGGLFYTGLIWLIEVGALCILIRAAEVNRSRSYQEIVTSTLGPRMAMLTSLTILLFVLGAMISFLIITGDVFQPIFAGWFGNDSTLSDRRFVITVFAVLVVLPLSLKRSLRELKWTGTISVIMLTYLTVALSTIGVAHLVDDGLSNKIRYFSGGMPAFIAIDIVVFSFHSHIQVVPIFAELAEHPWPFIGEGRKPLEERLLPVPEGLNIGRPLTRVRSIRLRRMDGIIFISMTICFVGYCLVGEFGYILFPDVESDVLKSFGSDNNFMNFARIGMCLVALACYPVQCYPARTILEDAIKHVFHRPANEASLNRHIIVTLLIFISTLVTALLITNLGTVFSIIGATGGVMVIFIIPGLLLTQQGLQQTPPNEEAYSLRERLEESLRWIKLIAGPLFVGLGALIFVVTAYITAQGLQIINPETPVLCQNLVFHHAC